MVVVVTVVHLSYWLGTAGCFTLGIVVVVTVVVVVALPMLLSRLGTGSCFLGIVVVVTTVCLAVICELTWNTDKGDGTVVRGTVLRVTGSLGPSAGVEALGVVIGTLGVVIGTLGVVTGTLGVVTGGLSLLGAVVVVGDLSGVATRLTGLREAT